LRGRVEETLRQAAEVINEDAHGCWAAATQARVLALFSALAHEALELALELRVGAAEGQVPPEQLAPGDWARRYRRMLAAQGHWPPAHETDPAHSAVTEPGAQDEPAAD
jgi:hypothetical protein